MFVNGSEILYGRERKQRAMVSPGCSTCFNLFFNLLECCDEDKQTEQCRHIRQTHPAQHRQLSKEMSIKM